MIYIIEESWTYPDEQEHCYYKEAFYSKEAAFSKAKELAEDEIDLFKNLDREYDTKILDDGYYIITTDSEFQYIVTVVALEEVKEIVDIYEVQKVYDCVSYKYKKFLEASNGQQPDFVEVSIKWKEDNKSERAIIAFNNKHDDLVTFRVHNLLELTLLFFKETGEDFICEQVFNMNFGIWQ